MALAQRWRSQPTELIVITAMAVVSGGQGPATLGVGPCSFAVPATARGFATAKIYVLANVRQPEPKRSMASSLYVCVFESNYRDRRVKKGGLIGRISSNSSPFKSIGRGRTMETELSQTWLGSV
jgi:hypothetical protein